MIGTSAASVPPPVPGQRGGDKRLRQWLATLAARIRFTARCLARPRWPLHPAGASVPGVPQAGRRPMKPPVMIGMIPAVLWGGPYCGDRISVPADACRLTRPDGSVYLRSSLTDSEGRPVFMLRLGRRTVSLPRQSDLA